MSLFTDNAEKTLASMPVERIGRFVLHRAGIRNVWQYDDLELVFAGGRLLLRGKNGAGKSKAMEMLLPFLLDGDTRNIDCVRRDRTTLAWLMTDGRDGGNQVGYMWIELRAVDADGTEEFRTLGCGVKAAPSTRRPTSWFFFTDKRVGAELIVADATGMVGQEAFREQLDADEYFTAATPYARKVAKDLFGIEDEVRYKNLCHLLYELRRPSVGENIEAGQPTEVLSEALPPLDDALLGDVARNFDDLKKIREDLARSEQTSRALNEFLDSYRGYTRTIVRSHASQTVEAAQAAAQTRTKLAAAEALAEQAQCAAEDAQAIVDDFENDQANANGELQVLMASPAYKSLQSINDRRDRVKARARASEMAAEAAARARSSEQAAARRADAEAEAVRAEAAATIAQRRNLEPYVAAAGLDTGVLPVPVTATDAADGSSEAPKRVDAAATRRAVEEYVSTLESLAANVKGRRINVQALVEVASQVTEAAGKVRKAEEGEALAEDAVTAAERAQSEAGEAAMATDRSWRGDLAAWLSQAQNIVAATDWAAVAEYASFDEDTPVGSLADIRDAERLVQAHLADPQQSASETVAAQKQAVGAAQAALADLRQRHQDVERQEERLPTPGQFATSPRDTTAGLPFYALVEVRPEVDADTAASIEAALEASGILDGWVTPAGTILSATTHDVVLSVDTPNATSTLNDVLIPALPPHSPIDTATVAALLASIAFNDDSATSMVGADGRWRLGVTRGAWSKDRVEYLGVGARRAARDRELRALEALIAAADVELTASKDALAAATRHLQAIVDLSKSLPPTDALVAAIAKVDARADVTRQARTTFDDRRQAADEARTAKTALDRDFAERAARANLPADAAELNALDKALDRLNNQLDHARTQPARINQAIERHLQEVAGWEEAAQARRELDATAAQEKRTYDTEAAQLAALEDVHGEDVRTVQASIDEAKRTLANAERELPAARTARDEANRASILAAEEVRRLHDHVGEADQLVEATCAVLGRILAGPGVADAAFGTTGPKFSPPERAADADDQARVRQLRSFAAKVAEAAAGGPSVNDSTILRRYETLNADGGLAAGYEAEQDETPDRVKTFVIHDDTGKHPVAVVAERLGREVQAAQGRLTERQEAVFSQFLLGELGDHLRRQLNDADALCAAMNASLAHVRTSHGLGVKLDWHLHDDVSAAREEAIPLLRESAAMRGEAKNRRLGELLGTLIEAERVSDPTASYEKHLRSALDYRTWHTFTIKVVDDSNPGRERKLSNKLAVSQGEQRVLAYLALFSGAAAFFDSLRRNAPRSPRVILLDDAFAKIDEPTHGRLLNLLVELNLDFIITSERVTGCVPGLSLEVYECLRDPRVRGVAIVHTHWDGQRAQLQAV
jgi:uncharacterized protein (TIGR02680 family)